MVAALRGGNPVSDPSLPLWRHRAPVDRIDAALPGPDCSTAIGGPCWLHSPLLVQALWLSQDHILRWPRSAMDVHVHAYRSRPACAPFARQNVPRNRWTAPPGTRTVRSEEHT